MCEGVTEAGMLVSGLCAQWQVTGCAKTHWQLRRTPTHPRSEVFLASLSLKEDCVLQEQATVPAVQELS